MDLQLASTWIVFLATAAVVAYYIQDERPWKRRRRLTTVRPLEPVPRRNPYLEFAGKPEQFRRLVRLTVPEFDEVFALVEVPIRRYLGPNSPRSPKAVFFSILAWMARPRTFHDIQLLCGGSAGTFSRDIKVLLPQLSEVIFDRYIRWPNPQQTVQYQGRTMYFPPPVDSHALAILDCVRLRVSKPNDREVADSLYAADKKFHCVKALVHSDYRGRIIDVYCEDPITRGRQSDITITRRWAANHEDQLHDMYPPGMVAIADCAFQGDCPVTILTPFTQNEPDIETEEGIAFNREIRAWRVVVENVFARVGGVWRIFRENFPWPLPSIDLLPAAYRLACALTQYMFISRDSFPRSADWSPDNLERWEELPEVQRHVAEGVQLAWNEVLVDADEDELDVGE